MARAKSQIACTVTILALTLTSWLGINGIAVAQTATRE